MSIPRVAILSMAILSLVLTFVALGCSTSTATPASSPLVLNLIAGQVVQQEITMDQTIIHDSILTTNKTVFGMTQSVEKVDGNGNATILVSCNSVNISIKVGNQLFEYDSKSGAPPPPELTFQTLILGTEALSVDRYGKTPPAQNPIASLHRKLMLLLPEQAVTVGDTWEAVATLPGSTEQITFTVTSRGTGVAEVSSRSRIQQDARDMTGEVIELQGDGVGTYRVDEKSGLLLSADITHKIASTALVGVSNEVRYRIKTLSR